MKIAFVNPPFLSRYSRNQRSPAVTKGGTFYYPFWLGLACGWAEKHKYNTTLYDFVATNTTQQEALKILKRGKYNLIVVDTATPSFPNDSTFADKVKKKLPTSTVIMVGTHASALPKEALLSTKYVDAAAIAEYDQTIVDAAKAIENKKKLTNVSGLCVRAGTRIIRTKPQKPLTSQQLDTFPFLSKVFHEHLNIKDYYFAAARYPMVMMITARGCPFACNFCIYWQTIHGKAHRPRSAQNVVDEFTYIRYALPGVKEIVIEDDTFTANIPRVREISKLLIEAKNPIPWSANVRVGIDLTTLKLMKQAGCRLLIVGFESGEQKLLDSMGKHATVKMAYDLVKNAKKAGLLIHGCFMVGNPGETRETMEKTLQHAIKLNPDSAQFYPLFVYPGTRSYAWFEKNKLLTTKDYSKWLNKDGEHNTVISLPHLSAKDMVSFCERAYVRYHFRPSYIAQKLKQLVTDPDEGFRSLDSALRYVRTKINSLLPKK